MTKIKLILILTLLMFVAWFYSCKKQPFMAPPEALLILSSEQIKIDINESTRVFIQGYHKDGTPLWDGTVIYFSVKNGTLTTTNNEPLSGSSIEMDDGAAVILAWGNQEMGEMEITAQSGAIKAAPDPLKITVGRIKDITNITASVSPERLPIGGGEAKIRAGIFDMNNLPIEGINVMFTTSAGHMLSNGKAKKTNASGVAEDTLSTVEKATVTITCGDKTKTVDVPVLADGNRPTAEFTFSPTTPQDLDTVYFNASQSKDSDGRIVEYKWNFGDNNQTYSTAGSTFSHRYNLGDIGDDVSRTFNVLLTVRDNDGLENSITHPVTVNTNIGVLDVTPNPYKFGAGIETHEFRVRNISSVQNTKIQFYVSSNTSWITVEGDGEGNTEDDALFTCGTNEANATGEIRSGTVTVTSRTQKVTVNITQDK